MVDGVPRGCIFKVGFDGENPYSGKVVLMDEGHHLTRPNKVYKSQLQSLRGYVESARNSVFVSCTGSMEADSSADPRALLDAVKGNENKALSDEGFLSSHHKRGLGFPRQRPAACADGAFSEELDGLLQRKELSSHSLTRYLYQAIRLQKEEKPEETLANYTNIHVYAGSAGQPACKAQIMRYPNCRPKFTLAVAEVIAAAKQRQKSVVMVSKRTGYKAMLWLLEAAAEKHGFHVAEYDQLADFNSTDNKYGKNFMVLLLTTEHGGESIQAFCVRVMLLLDVPGLRLVKTQTEIPTRPHVSTKQSINGAATSRWVTTVVIMNIISQPSALNPQPSALNPQPSTLNPKP